ncbi:A disintegrin and metalloproteinase with thrombospondin motifs 7 [Brachionichthys hirsutus]|uniref:A disintegrin and metalloproteinase with thrombospondin motifs 7 n=1 Tax=Brachionichthys hirsutus TaxID=412623 RepID=UPI003605412D
MTRPRRGRGAIPVFIALLVVLENCNALGLPNGAERFRQDLPQYEVVHPTRVDARGHFLSNFLSHHARRVQRREASERPADSDRVFYQLWRGGRSLHFNLTLNQHLLSPGFLTERRHGGLEGARLHRPTSSQCHFLGEVWDEATVRGGAAISTCGGLTGLFRLADDEFFIQPLEKTSDEAPQAHAVYKRHAFPRHAPAVRSISGEQAFNGTCGITNSHQSSVGTERTRERWEHRQQRRRTIRQRSVSKEKWVETLVVADAKMVEYHGSKAVESYVLAVMNIVAGLFRDSSIGNAINIVVVRLVLLEQDEDDLKITHHADNSLSSFCKWQKKLNVKGDEHPSHHDVSVLLTRKDICAAVNTPCETLGLSHVAGMCQPHRSCSISEDTGLPLAFTVAHELGHNFGIQHDGDGNDCEPIGKRPFVMSPQLLYGTSLPRWSRCSRQYITRFLDRGWGWCLDDTPVKEKLSLTSVLPGVLYSAAHQCRLQYGSGSLLCDDMDNVCSTLWCTMGKTCHSKLDGAVDGTRCGEDKWCFSGECVPVGHQPEGVDGGWASWSEWSACSRTCGAGAQSAHRECDNPVPKYRGKYCLGERRRYQVCSSTPCPSELPTFRDSQCRHFNTMPYKGKLYKWETVVNRVSPCELHCRPLKEHFSEKMRDAVIDGTPCYEGNKSRNMCINGICKKVGCDYVIESSAVEDRCGVCNGDGSTCATVRRTFEESEGLGYVDIGLIPAGAWDIRIEEVAEAGNFLALRSDNPNKYFLNGGWTIQWNGEYKAAGTVFTYERTGHLENLTSPGPTMEPLWIQLLFQETNPGVRYEYTISQDVSEDNDVHGSGFFWKYGSWTECSVTCGTGVQRQIVHCVEKTTGIMEGHMCDPSTRPADNQTSCNKDPCPAIWWAGEWQKCSSSCGSLGQAKRTVLCIQAVDVEEQKALQPSECEHVPKPESLSSCNTHIPCPADWTVSSWSKCSLTCGNGVRHRNVTCSRNTGIDCDPQKRPLAVSVCFIQDCPQVVDNFAVDWSGSGWSSKEVLNEINSIPEVKPPPKYGPTRAQPRNHNNLHNVVEGDFHYHNIIENVDRSPVQVDDFYYDYNFINFHEDLSDDFDDPGESHGIDASQESKPGSSAEEDAYTEMTEQPIRDNGNATTKESVQTNREYSRDFLSEEALLPVFTTRSPPLSTAQRSETSQKANNSVWRPDGVTTMPIPAFSTEEPTQDAKYGEEAENSDDSFTEEENLIATSVRAAPAPEYRTFTNAAVTTPGARETPEQDHSASDKSTGLDMSADQEDVEGREPTAETVIQSEVQLDNDASGTPHATSQSEIFQTAFTLEHVDSNQTDFDAVSATRQYLWDSDPDLGATSLPASEKATSLPAPVLINSGNRATSDDSISVTGKDITPPTSLKADTLPPPADFLPATAKYKPTEPAFSQRPGTDSTSRTPSFSSAAFDYSEEDIPEMVTTSRDGDPNPSHQLPESRGPEQSTPSGLHMESPTPAAPLFPSRPPLLRPTSVNTLASTLLPTAAHWVTGNWSSCSTTCGLGAIWRALACSTGSDSDCDPAKRPAPAQRCYLRPCSTWKVEEWNKCSKSCDGGIKSRGVQCFDMRDQRLLRPFHCRAMSSRPPILMPCNLQPCLDWYASSWGQCSEVCGGGKQQRIVACPEEDRCNKELQPANIQSCNSQSCAQWLTGSWGQCSAPCGGGVQHRLIKCVNTKAETDEAVDQAQCDHKLQPETTQKCNLQKCKSGPSGAVCVRDRLTNRFCQTLRWLGRCHLANIRGQCCKTCSQRSVSSSAKDAFGGAPPETQTPPPLGSPT